MDAHRCLIIYYLCEQNTNSTKDERKKNWEFLSSIELNTLARVDLILYIEWDQRNCD